VVAMRGDGAFGQGGPPHPVSGPRHGRAPQTITCDQGVVEGRDFRSRCRPWPVRRGPRPPGGSHRESARAPAGNLCWGSLALMRHSIACAPEPDVLLAQAERFAAGQCAVAFGRSGPHPSHHFGDRMLHLMRVFISDEEEVAARSRQENSTVPTPPRRRMPPAAAIGPHPCGGRRSDPGPAAGFFQQLLVAGAESRVRVSRGE